MGLKYIVTKTEHEALPEATRALYKEANGKFTLDVDDVAPMTEVTDLRNKVGEFRDTNIRLTKDVEKFKPVHDAVTAAGITDVNAHITEFKTLKEKGISKPDDVTTAINAALKPIQDALKAEQDARAAAETRANQSTFRELVTADANKAGVKPTALHHVIRDAEDVFELKDGKLVAKTGRRHPTDASKELTPTDWLHHLSTTQDFLFGESTGGGASNPGRGPKPGARVLRNPTPLEMGQNMDAIAKGEVVVERT
jgi:hypothetical protein